MVKTATSLDYGHIHTPTPLYKVTVMAMTRLTARLLPGTTEEADILQLIALAPPTHLVALHERIQIDIRLRNEVKDLVLKITHIRALEKEWVVWYGMSEQSCPVSLYTPIQWTLLPPVRKLEYLILYQSLPDYLSKTYQLPMKLEEEEKPRRRANVEVINHAAFCSEVVQKERAEAKPHKTIVRRR